MDHNMVFSYDYGKQKKGWQKNECTSVVGHLNGYSGAPEQYRQHCLMQHAQATQEATGPCHWETTLSVPPQRPPGQQQTKQQQKSDQLCWPF
jgi:hypothetical protein